MLHTQCHPFRFFSHSSDTDLILLYAFVSGDEEAMDHQESPEPENSHSDTVDGEEDSEPENGPNSSGGKSFTSRPKLFSFSMVNSYGTANISSLPFDGNLLKLTSNYYLFTFDTKNVSNEY